MTGDRDLLEDGDVVVPEPAQEGGGGDGGGPTPKERDLHRGEGEIFMTLYKLDKSRQLYVNQ